MDGQRHGYVPGSLLGRLRHGAAAGGGRWRKLPPEAAGADTITERNADTDSNPGAHADPVSDPDAGADPGANPDSRAEPNAGADSDPGTVADTVGNTIGDADPQRVSNGHTVAEGHAFSANTSAHGFPDPHTGPGGRVTAVPPAAAQAAGWAGPHGHRRRATSHRSGGIPGPGRLGPASGLAQQSLLLSRGVAYHQGMLVITTGIPR